MQFLSCNFCQTQAFNENPECKLAVTFGAPISRGEFHDIEATKSFQVYTYHAIFVV